MMHYTQQLSIVFRDSGAKHPEVSGQVLLCVEINRATLYIVESILGIFLQKPFFDILNREKKGFFHY
jgi:hypothetical protein